MTLAPDSVYTNSDDSLEVFLALRGLLNNNRCALEFDDETLAQLIYVERYMSRRVEAYEVECAREALSVEGEVRT